MSLMVETPASVLGEWVRRIRGKEHTGMSGSLACTTMCLVHWPSLTWEALLTSSSRISLLPLSQPCQIIVFSCAKSGSTRSCRGIVDICHEQIKRIRSITSLPSISTLDQTGATILCPSCDPVVPVTGRHRNLVQKELVQKVSRFLLALTTTAFADLVADCALFGTSLYLSINRVYLESSLPPNLNIFCSTATPRTVPGLKKDIDINQENILGNIPNSLLLATLPPSTNLTPINLPGRIALPATTRTRTGIPSSSRQQSSRTI